jgi:peptidoglycan hydrolase CwlO-like protein
MITLIATVGSLVGAFGIGKAISKDKQKNISSETALTMKLDFISNNVSSIQLDMKDIKNDIKNQDSRINANEKDIVRVEEMAKSAHKRIDELEEK